MSCDGVTIVFVTIFAIAMAAIVVHFFILEPRRLDREYQRKMWWWK